MASRRSRGQTGGMPPPADASGSAPAPSPKRRTWRRRLALLAGLLALALVLALVALQVAGTWFVSRKLPALLARNPDRVLVTWEDLAFHPPRGARVKALRIRGQTHRLQWELRVDEATSGIGIMALTRKTLHFDGIDARGVTLRMRAFPEPGETGSPHAPPIEGFPDAPLTHEMRPPRRVPPARRWTWIFTDGEARDVREIWIGPWRFEGPGDARVEDVRVRAKELLRVEDARFVARGGALHAAGMPAADAIDTRAEFSIVGYDPVTEKAGDILRHSSGRVAGTASLQELSLPDVHFPKLPWLGFGGARGRLTHDIRVEDGVLQPGSTFDLEADDLALAGLAWRARGAARVAGRVEAGESGAEGRVDAHLARYELGTPSAARAMIQGEGLDLSVMTRDLALFDPLGAHEVKVNVPEARFADLAAVQALLPAGLPLQVLGGDGKVSARLHATHESGEGDVKLHVDGMDLRWEGLRMRGTLDVDGRMPSVDPAALRFDLSGTKVALKDFVTGEGQSASRGGWWGDVQVPRGEIAAADAVRFDGDVRARFADTRPIIAVIDAVRGIPALAKPLLKAKDVDASFGLRTAPDAMDLRDLEVTADGLDIRACMSRRGRSQRGWFWLDSGLISAGVTFVPGDRDVKLFAGRKWLAARPADCASGR